MEDGAFAMTMARERAAANRVRIREAVDFLLWVYTPFRPIDASGIYDLVSTNAFTAQGLYLNLGYWKNARTIDQACEGKSGRRDGRDGSR
jgi:hypothetical protein